MHIHFPAFLFPCLWAQIIHTHTHTHTHTHPDLATAHTHTHILLYLSWNSQAIFFLHFLFFKKKFPFQYAHTFHFLLPTLYFFVISFSFIIWTAIFFFFILFSLFLSFFPSIFLFFSNFSSFYLIHTFNLHIIFLFCTFLFHCSDNNFLSLFSLFLCPFHFPLFGIFFFFLFFPPIFMPNALCMSTYLCILICTTSVFMCTYAHRSTVLFLHTYHKLHCFVFVFPSFCILVFVFRVLAYRLLSVCIFLFFLHYSCPEIFLKPFFSIITNRIVRLKPLPLQN